MAKQFKFVDSRLGKVDQRSFGCGRRERYHDGVCRSFSCRNCGKDGHFGRICLQSVRVCFHCDQEGHIRGYSPLLIFGEVQNPTRLAWQMPDGCQGRAEVPWTKERAYLFVVEDPNVATTSTVGTFPIYFIFHL